MLGNTKLATSIYIATISVACVAIPLAVCLALVIYTAMNLFGLPMRLYTRFTPKEKHHGK